MRESKKKYAELQQRQRQQQQMNSNSTSERIEWEMRPGGMLVQKRDESAEAAAVAAGPMIRVRVSFGAVYHEVTISPYATFGDLKKALVSSTGLQAKEQRILYRGKEKESGDFLHLVGVKDKAKVVLIEDPESRERKLEESRHMERVARSAKAVSAIKSEVDKLAEMVLIVETDVHSRRRVPVSEFDGLTEKLMMQLLKLDGLEVFGDVKAQRRVQVRRVQKFVEALDALKLKNSSPNSQQRNSSSSSSSSSSEAAVIQATPAVAQTLSKSPSSSNSAAVITAQWETFNSGGVTAAAAAAAAASAAAAAAAAHPRPVATAIESDWERALFSMS